jgi:hypothetical protein
VIAKRRLLSRTGPQSEDYLTEAMQSKKFVLKNQIFFHKFFFKKFQNSKIYYLKWILRIEVGNGKQNICYSIFGVYLVTVTNYPDISQEGTFRITIFFYHHALHFDPRVRERQNDFRFWIPQSM